jgi:hypothetical protein
MTKATTSRLLRRMVAPPRVRYKSAALPLRVLESVGREPRREEPCRSGNARRGDHSECQSDTPLSTAMTYHHPSTTANPIKTDAITASPKA